MLKRVIVSVLAYSIVLYVATLGSFQEFLGFGVSSDRYEVLPLFFILGVLFWLGHGIVTKILHILSFPLYILTLGLFSLVVNVLFLYIFQYGVGVVFEGSIVVALGTLVQTALLSLFIAMLSLLLRKIL